VILGTPESSCDNGILRMEARLTWEDADKPPFDLFVETDAAVDSESFLDPNAVLLACFFPAWRGGERRVRVNGPICPVLFENLKVAVAHLAFWYPALPSPCPVVESASGFVVRQAVRHRALSLMSCGVDSLATLRWNRTHIPPDHPASVKAVVCLAFQPGPSDTPPPPTGRIGAAVDVARDAGVQLVPVRTNLWWLVRDGFFFDDVWHGALLASMGWFFSSSSDRTYIPSSYLPHYPAPWGSHPLLDHFYSGAHMTIEHHGIFMSRLEKTALVAGWPTALRNLRVCQNDESGSINCGTCEKCLRTKTALAALGQLDACPAFEDGELTPEHLGTIRRYDLFASSHTARWWVELLPALLACGRNDLGDAVGDVLAYAKEKEARSR
jgi:hypothetical protein